MSLAGALVGGSRPQKGQCKTGKYHSRRAFFYGKIITETEKLRPYGQIDGQIILDGECGMGHYGICVQLEAEMKYKFITKAADNMPKHHTLWTNIMEGVETDEDDPDHQISPVRMVIVADEVYPNYYSIEPTKKPVTFSFSLKMSGDTLPAPFKSTYGSLTYKIVAYMRSTNSSRVEIAEKVLRFRGYHNLSQNLDVLKPIEVGRSFKMSVFSSKKAISVTLSLPESGYLAEEDVPFCVTCINYRCQPLCLEIVLLQRSTYNVNGAKKTSVASLGSALTEVNEPTQESVWQSSFKIHKAASPSYCINPIYTMAHAVQFRVKVGQYVVLKGEAPVFIGTTRESIEALMLSANSLNGIDDRFSNRRGSITSECSAFSCVTLPPAYSQLSSRAPSLETLPPAYDDIPQIKEDNDENLECDAQPGTLPPPPPTYH